MINWWARYNNPIVGNVYTVRKDLARHGDYGDCAVVSSMERYRGKQVTIKHIDPRCGYIKVEETHWSWVKEMFEEFR